MFDFSELDRWDEALASLASTAPVQTPAHGHQRMHYASPTVGGGQIVDQGAEGGCPFGYGGTTHDG